MGKAMKDSKKYSIDTTMISQIWFFFFAIYAFLFMRLKVIGLKNLVGKKAFILSSNHLEQVDSFLLYHVMPRPVFFMAKEDIFLNPVSSFICRRLGAFPVHRKGFDRWALEHAFNILSKGRILGMYPEGERSRTKTMQKGKNGPAYLATKAKVPIVPVAITGTNRLFTNFPRRTIVTVEVGKPIYPHNGESVYELTDRLMSCIAVMLPAEMRGVYGHCQSKKENGPSRCILP